MANTQLEKYRRIAKTLKNPTPVELPSHKFRCQVTVDGHRESVVDEDPRVAHAQAVAIRASLMQIKKAPGRKTVSSAIDDYIQSKSSVLSPSTISGYRAIQRTRFQEAMPENIFELDERQWQEYCNQEAAICSAKTLKNAWMFLSSVIYKTTRKKYEVTLPPVTRKGRPYLDHDQILVFVAAVRGKPFEIPALLALCSLRRSEILGLRWSDIDTGKNLVTVSGAAVMGEGSKLIYKASNKNQTSQRLVPILIPQLREAVLEQERNPEDHVLTGNPNQLWAQVNDTCEKCGLPKVGVHGLRHSFASLAYYLNIPEKVAMEIGGWADNQTMHEIYTHISEKDVGARAADIRKFYETGGESTQDIVMAQKDAEIESLKNQLNELQQRLEILNKIQEQFSVLMGTLNKNAHDNAHEIS